MPADDPNPHPASDMGARGQKKTRMLPEPHFLPSAGSGSVRACIILKPIRSSSNSSAIFRRDWIRRSAASSFQPTRCGHTFRRAVSSFSSRSKVHRVDCAVASVAALDYTKRALGDLDEISSYTSPEIVSIAPGTCSIASSTGSECCERCQVPAACAKSLASTSARFRRHASWCSIGFSATKRDGKSCARSMDGAISKWCSSTRADRAQRYAGVFPRLLAFQPPQTVVWSAKGLGGGGVERLQNGRRIALNF